MTNTYNELIIDLFAKAKKRQLNRSVHYSWQSLADDIEKLPHTGEAVGVRIDLTIEHIPKRKVYSAHLSRAHYQKSKSHDGFAYEITHWAPYMRDVYPYMEIATEPTARYSEKALVKFAEKLKADLSQVCEVSPNVLRLLTEALNLV